MDQGNKLYRKCQRPRPYDLRRKVLLKNFLKEQMTFIPQVNEMEFEDEPTVDEENKAQYSNDLSSANSNEMTDHGEFGELNSTFSIEMPIEDQANTVSLKDSASSSDKLPLVDHNTKEIVSKTAKFSSFMKLRSSKTKQKKTSSISKAKHNRRDLKSPIKDKPFIKAEISRKLKSFTRKVDSCNEDETFLKPIDDRSEQDSKNSNEHNGKNKSLAWRLFRPFRTSKITQKGRAKNKKSLVQKVVNIAEASISDEGSRTLISRSVQTDVTGAWDMDRLEQSNVLLKEENKLLVESISYFMNDTEIPTRNSVFSDYQPHSSSSTNSSSSKTFEWLDYSDNIESHHKSKRAKLEIEEVRMQKMYKKSSRISRSKSVQERDNAKGKAKYCHRTQSMRTSSSKSRPIPDRKTSFYSQNLRMNSWHLNENSHISIPRVKSPSKLQNLSVSNSSRQIQR